MSRSFSFSGGGEDTLEGGGQQEALEVKDGKPAVQRKSSTDLGSQFGVDRTALDRKASDGARGETKKGSYKEASKRRPWRRPRESEGPSHSEVNEMIVQEGDREEFVQGAEEDSGFEELEDEFPDGGDTYVERLTRITESEAPPETMVADCLMPSGVLIPLTCPIDITFGAFKALLWQEAQKYPMGSKLNPVTEYSFAYINDNADLEELMHDSVVLSRLACSTMLIKVGVKRGSRDEKLLSATIGALIGKALMVYNRMNNREIEEFRRNMVDVCNRATEAIRSTNNGYEIYILSPSIASNPIPSHVLAKMTSNHTFLVSVQVEDARTNATAKFTFVAHKDDKPQSLTERTLKKRDEIFKAAKENPTDYVLQVQGMSEFLVGDYVLCDFIYVRQCLAKARPILLGLIRRDTVLPDTNPPAPMPVSYLPPSTTEGIPRDVDKSAKFTIKVAGASNLTYGDVQALYVRVGVFHGGIPQCRQLRTNIVPASADPTWNETLVFDISLHDLPRTARLCFTLYGVFLNPSSGQGTSEWGRANSLDGGQIDRQSRIGLVWVNCNIFNYHGVMQGGPMVLHTWPCDPDERLEAANPIGTVVENPDKVSTASINIEFAQSCVHEEEDDEEDLGGHESVDSLHLQAREGDQTKEDKGRLHQMFMMDPLTSSKLSQQDKTLLWIHRIYCASVPQALPKLLRSVRWNMQEVVQEVHSLLKIWAPLSPEDALELLDANFADRKVRAFAVKCLERLPDDKLLQYLMQLVQSVSEQGYSQVLKYESYLDCKLARFLLYRALTNRRVGHHLFWALRSEMHMPEVSVRFGLLLEAYCRGCAGHMEDLMAQVGAMSKLVDVANGIKKKHLNTKEKKLDVLRASLNALELQPFALPLNPSVKVAGTFVMSKCSFMDSKKMPLWLVFENMHPAAPDVYVIFKAGDDLRQDMLTLQMVQIMDSLWQAEGLDLRMVPYGCISTGDEVGMVEVVLNSKTIWNIQNKWGGGARGAFKDDPLHKWLSEVNPDPKKYDAAVEHFSLSCAGYCVATYVLGIGDRHNDNIMIKTSGQIFHIDFGHFLGNFKSKFGVRRERVPFVLTPDFVYVIAGKQGRNSEQFVRFKELCKSAYVILRKHANLLINLFAMMLSTGIPQLRSTEDLHYLRDVLMLQVSESEAVSHFEKKIDEALDNSWSTRVNWAIHGMVH